MRRPHSLKAPSAFRRIVLGALAFASCLVAAPTSLSGATTVTGTPTNVRVTLGVGTVRVSWQAVVGTDVTYDVTSRPSGLTCSLVTSTSCVIVVTTSTPYQFAVTATSSGRTSVPSALTAIYPRRTVLILAGQSNAQGAESFAISPTTGIDYLAAPYTNGADKNSDLVWLPWFVAPQPAGAAVPLDTPQIAELPNDTAQIFGPEIGLARQIWTDRHRAVTIIKTTYGGSSLKYNWSPTEAHGLFSDMLAKVRGVMRGDAENGQFDVLGGFYWYQGEADAELGYGSTYREELSSFISHLRSDLIMNPSAPFVIAEESLTAQIYLLRATGTCPHKTCTGLVAGNYLVRTADQWNAAHVASTVLVDTEGLPREPDHVHLSDVGELMLGAAMAKASDGALP